MCTLAFSLWRNQIHNLQDLKKICPAQNEKHWNISVLFWGWSLTTTSVWRETFIARSVTCCTHSSSETARWLEWSCLECYPIKICTSLIIRSGLHVASFMQVVRSERTKKTWKSKRKPPTNKFYRQIFANLCQVYGSTTLSNCRASLQCMAVGPGDVHALCLEWDWYVSVDIDSMILTY